MMKKILFLLLPAVMLFSCSQENQLTDYESTKDLTEASTSMESQRQALMESDTYIGIYKGVFTTNNSSYRATVEIIIPNSSSVTDDVVNQPTAILTLVDGTTVTATAQPDTADNVEIENLRFSSNELSFQFSVNLDGTNAEISNVLFNQEDAAILVTKHSNRAPITPVTGTYVCTECQGHPYLNTNFQQSWNVIIDENTGVMMSQVAFGPYVFNGVGLRSNCSDDGNYTYCDINGGDGNSDVAFTAMGGDVSWSGNLQFSNLPPNPNTDCSEMSGDWIYETSTYGTITGTFISDSVCGPTPPYTLLDENYQNFEGKGFSPGAESSTGRLDSNIYRLTGFAQNRFNFGDTHITGVFARGMSPAGATQEGIYSYDTGDGNRAVGIRPGGADWTPGFAAIRLMNNTGNTITSFNVSYDLYVNNDRNRANFVKFSYSLEMDDPTFTFINSMYYVSPELADSNGFVRNTRSGSFDITVAPGEYIYLRLSGDDVSGSGGRDEFAIDNLLVTAQ